jgi:anti-sigma factor RsiW
MRHIPEEELHAYLDQGLSRSQCVEIESHLASCPSCQAARDGIAALRDRTTALLAKLAPPRKFPPPFDSLRRRAALEATARRRRVHAAAWAASLVAALGVGWTASSLVVQRPVAAGQPAQPPAAAPVTSSRRVDPAVLRPRPSTVVPARSARRQSSRQAPRRPTTVTPDTAGPVDSLRPVDTLPLIALPTLELSSIDIPRANFDLELDGMWRTLSWDGAQAEAGERLPHIDGLPVVQVQLQSVEEGKKPLMVVAQQLTSGEVIRTIEGPMNDVSHLLARRTMTDPDSSATTDSAYAGAVPINLDRTMAMQRGDRMLVITGALPQDSLRAMIRRLNAEMRSK